MNTNMRVEDPQKLVSDGKELITFGEQYSTCISNIYQTVDELANSSWKGEKASKYIDAIEEYRQPLNELGEQISNMGDGLKKAGEALLEFEGLM